MRQEVRSIELEYCKTKATLFYIDALRTDFSNAITYRKVLIFFTLFLNNPQQIKSSDFQNRARTACTKQTLCTQLGT